MPSATIQAARGRQPVAREKILKWVTEHPDVEFTVADVTKVTKTSPSSTRTTLMRAKGEWLPGSLVNVTSRKFKYLPHDTKGAQVKDAKPKARGKAKPQMPKSMTFKVVAELSGGRLMLDLGGNYFVARPVDL